VPPATVPPSPPVSTPAAVTTVVAKVADLALCPPHHGPAPDPGDPPPPTAACGQECQWCTARLFSKLAVPLALPTVPADDFIAKALAPPPADAPATTPASLLKMAGIDVRQEPDAPVVTVTAEAELNMPVAILGSASLPFVKLDLQADDSTFVTVALPQGIQLTGEATKLPIVVRTTFANGEDVQTKVATLVDRVLARGGGPGHVASRARCPRVWHDPSPPSRHCRVSPFARRAASCATASTPTMAQARSPPTCSVPLALTWP
jgi:hypothetical protein